MSIAGIEDHAATLRADAREVGEQRQPVARGLLGVELHAEDVAALDDRGERLAVLAAADHVARLGRPAGERVHVVEGRRLAEALGERRLALEGDEVPADVRAAWAPRSGVTSPPQQAEARRRPRARSSARTAAAWPRQTPSSGAPDAARSRSSSSSPSARDVAHRLRERADAGQDHAVGGADRVVVARDHRARADVLERLLDAAPVAHPVVDDRDHASSVPLVDGTPVSRGSTATAARSARANALKHASIMWWAFVPACSSRCSVSRAAEATARKNSSAASCSKPAMSPGRQPLEALAGAVRPPGDVDRARRARLVHRDHGVPVADDAAALAERAVERLAEHDPGVLDRVVRARLRGRPAR